MANAYVTNIPGNAVFIINLQTNKVAGKFTVPLPSGITLSPNAKTIYVASQSGNNVWIFNTQTRKLIAKVGVGKSPQGVAVTPNGNLIWVANSGDNTVSIIHARTRKVIRVLRAGKQPNQIAISPDGKLVLISNSNSNTLSVFRTLTRKRIATIPVGQNPGHIAFTPDGTRAYIINSGSNDISVINISTKKETARISLKSTGSTQPYGIAVGRNGKRLYVTEFLDGLIAIAIPANKIVRNLVFTDQTTGAKAPQGIAIRQNRLYMVASANDQVEIRALPSLRVIATIRVPSTLESEQGLQEIIVG